MTTEGFHLDEDTHTYTLDAEQLESPSGVLVDLGLVDPRFYTPLSRQRGKVVHAVLAAVLQGYTYKEADLHPDLRGFVRSGVALIDRLRPKILEVERPRCHPLYKFAGTMDVRVLLNSCEWIWDWKTGKVAKAERFKLAAYDMLAGTAPGGRQRRRAAIELQEDGSLARMIEFPDPTDGGQWLALLTATRVRRQLHRLTPLPFLDFADIDLNSKENLTA